MTNEEHAVKAVEFFIETFNAQEHAKHAQALNYPHFRLANGRFTEIQSAEEFERGCRRNEPRLRAEGWHHTIVRELDVIHVGVDKVHVAITNDRCHEDGTVYNSFDTLWIATNVDGHWGIQFRSSFLGS